MPIRGERVRGMAGIQAVAAGLAAMLAGISPGAAQTFTIDFESFDLGGQVYLDTADTIMDVDAAGSGVTVTIEGGRDLRIYDLILFCPGGTASGQALIDYDWDAEENPAGTTIRFDTPLEFVSLTAGDFGGDADTPLALVAYDSAGVEIGSSFSTWPEDQMPPFSILSVSEPGIRSVHYSSGGDTPGSTFLDDLTFTPEGGAPLFATSWGRIKGFYR